MYFYNSCYSPSREWRVILPRRAQPKLPWETFDNATNDEVRCLQCSHACFTSWCYSVAYFIIKYIPSSSEPTLNFNGELAKFCLTSLVRRMRPDWSSRCSSDLPSHDRVIGRYREGGKPTTQRHLEDMCLHQQPKDATEYYKYLQLMEENVLYILM